MHRKNYATILLLALVWAGYYRAVEIANKGLSPHMTGFMVRLGVFVLLTLALSFAGRLGEIFRVGRAWPYLLAIGAMGFLLDITAFVGFRLSDASTGAILLKTDVLMVNALSVAVYRERLRGADWALSALMLVGVALLLGIHPQTLSFRMSDGFFLLSALCISINAFIIRHVQTRTEWSVSNDTIAYYNNFITMLCFLGMLIFTGDGGEWVILTEDPSLCVALAAGALGQFLIYRLYYSALRRMPVWQVKSLLLLTPVVTVISGAIFFAERLSGLKQIGMALVLASAAAMLLGQRHRKPAPAKG